MVFKLYRNKVGDNVVKAMNVIGQNSLGFGNQRNLHKEASICFHQAWSVLEISLSCFVKWSSWPWP